MTIRYIEPLQRAVERAVVICFKPFDLGKWFVLGFACWLARLAQGGGGGGGLNVPIPPLGDRDAEGADLPVAGWQGVAASSFESWLEDPSALVPLVIAALGCAALFVLVLIPVLIWVSSRAQFVFLDGVVHNRALIAEPWNTFSAEGNSLFLWRLGFLVASILIFVLALVPAGLFIWRTGIGEPPVTSILLLLLPILAAGIAIGFVDLFLRSFVVPIMYHERLRATQAWGVFLPLLRRHLGSFLVYGLWMLALAVGILLGLVILAFATCCIAGVLMIIPYLGTVLLLPIHVSLRAVSLEFLAQFSPDFRIFPEAPPPAPEPAPAAA